LLEGRLGAGGKTVETHRTGRQTRGKKAWRRTGNAKHSEISERRRKCGKTVGGGAMKIDFWSVVNGIPETGRRLDYRRGVGRKSLQDRDWVYGGGGT